MTIRYEVALSAPPDQAAGLAQWMRSTHIPDVLATGCFIGARFERGESPGAFRTCYLVADPADLARYLAAHAPALRADFQARVPAGVQVARAVWTELDAWTHPPRPGHPPPPRG